LHEPDTATVVRVTGGEVLTTDGPFAESKEHLGGFVGAWAVAPLAGEWIHHAVLAIRAEIPLAVLRDTIAQFPTYSEGYVSALRTLPGRTASGRR